jgi:DtxR family Mn-dependent transcriptional regulator
MVYHNNFCEIRMVNQKMSESEEMYLVTMARLAEHGVEEPIPLSLLAEELSVLPVSVNQMVRKMAEEGYLIYLPYKGVEFTPQGRRLARQVLRGRRLWEVFLVDHLEFSPLEAEALACRMEHITTSIVADRLSSFLGEPATNPRGKPIPGESDNEIEIPARLLGELKVGQRAEVLHLVAESAASDFLDAQGIHPGAEVAVLAAGSQGSLLLDVGGRQVNLTGDVASCVFVKEIAVSTGAVRLK